MPGVLPAGTPSVAGLAARMLFEFLAGSGGLVALVAPTLLRFGFPNMFISGSGCDI